MANAGSAEDLRQSLSVLGANIDEIDDEMLSLILQSSGGMDEAILACLEMFPPSSSVPTAPAVADDASLCNPIRPASPLQGGPVRSVGDPVVQEPPSEHLPTEAIILEASSPDLYYKVIEDGAQSPAKTPNSMLAAREYSSADGNLAGTGHPPAYREVTLFDDMLRKLLLISGSIKLPRSAKTGGIVSSRQDTAVFVHNKGNKGPLQGSSRDIRLTVPLPRNAASIYFECDMLHGGRVQVLVDLNEPLLVLEEPLRCVVGFQIDSNRIQVRIAGPPATNDAYDTSSSIERLTNHPELFRQTSFDVKTDSCAICFTLGSGQCLCFNFGLSAFQLPLPDGSVPFAGAYADGFRRREVSLAKHWCSGESNTSLSFTTADLRNHFDGKQTDVELNRAGVPVKLGIGPGQNNFYCSRVLGIALIPHSDGQCGPSNGPQCPDCLGLGVGPNKVKRPGSTSSYPAAKACIPSAVSACIFCISETGSVQNMITMGVCGKDFPTSASNGVGRTTGGSWGIADDRSKEDEPSYFCANGSNVARAPRKLKLGDIVVIYTDLIRGEMLVCVNNSEFSFLFSKKSPGKAPIGAVSDFRYGCTLASEHAISLLDGSDKTSLSQWGPHLWPQPQDITNVCPLLAVDEEQIFEVGATVSIKDVDECLAEIAQDGSGGWTKTMRTLLGQQGQVVELKSANTVTVKIGSHTHTWSRQLVDLVKAAHTTSTDSDSGDDLGFASSIGVGLSSKDFLKMFTDVTSNSPSSIEHALLDLPVNSNLLHVATRLQDVTAVESLVKQGVSVSAVDEASECPLAIACRLGNTDIIEHLLNAGASIDIKGRTGESLLFTAVKSSNLAVVRLLTDHAVGQALPNEPATFRPVPGLNECVVYSHPKIDGGTVTILPISMATRLRATICDGWGRLHSMSPSFPEIDALANSEDEGCWVQLSDTVSNKVNWLRGDTDINQRASVDGSTLLMTALQTQNEDIALYLLSVPEIEKRVALGKVCYVVREDVEVRSTSALDSLVIRSLSVGDVVACSLKQTQEPADCVQVEIIDGTGWCLLSNSTTVFLVPALPGPGTRVRRGKDWKWDFQDGGEGHLGTVISSTVDKSDGNDHVDVLWDHGSKNRYRFHSGAYDVEVDFTASLQSGWTYLNLACSYGMLRFIKFLLEEFQSEGLKDLDTPNDLQLTPLNCAVINGHYDVVAYLLSFKPLMDVPDIKGFTPVHNAVNNGSADIAELLISAKSEIAIPLTNGTTPLITAATKGFNEIVKLIVGGIGDSASIDGTCDAGRTPLHAAVLEGLLSTADILLSSRANPNATLRGYGSPLHIAASHKSEDMCKLLVSSSATLEAVNDEGATPLLVACYHLNPDVVSMLLQSGANVNATCRQLPAEANVGHPAVDVISGFGPGDQVILAENYSSYGDAGEGPLKPGDVGIVSKLDPSDDTVNVSANGRSWWYHKHSLCFVGGLGGKEKGNNSAKAVTYGEIVLGDEVVLSEDYQAHGDASSGPLKPGLIGVVIDIDTDSKPFKVLSGSGKEWWYSRLALKPAVVRETKDVTALLSEDLENNSRLSAVHVVAHKLLHLLFPKKNLSIRLTTEHIAVSSGDEKIEHLLDLSSTPWTSSSGDKPHWINVIVPNGYTFEALSVDLRVSGGDSFVPHKWRVKAGTGDTANVVIGNIRLTEKSNAVTTLLTRTEALASGVHTVRSIRLEILENHSSGQNCKVFGIAMEGLMRTPTGTVESIVAINDDITAARLVIAALLEYKMDINVTNSDGDTAVNVAAALGSEQVVRLLAGSFSADVNIPNKSYLRNPLESAAMMGHTAALKTLIAFDAIAQDPPNLMLSVCERGYNHIVDALMDISFEFPVTFPAHSKFTELSAYEVAQKHLELPPAKVAKIILSHLSMASTVDSSSYSYKIPHDRSHHKTPTLRLKCGLPHNFGVYYFEVEMIAGGLCQLGISTDNWQPTEKGVGGDLEGRSIGIDGSKSCLHFQGRQIKKLSSDGGFHWAPGSVIGVLINTAAKSIDFSYCGILIDGWPDVDLSTIFVSNFFVPVCTIDNGQAVSFNFGLSPFKYTPESILHQREDRRSLHNQQLASPIHAAAGNLNLRELFIQSPFEYLDVFGTSLPDSMEIWQTFKERSARKGTWSSIDMSYHYHGSHYASLIDCVKNDDEHVIEMLLGMNHSLAVTLSDTSSFLYQQIYKHASPSSMTLIRELGSSPEAYLVRLTELVSTYNPAGNEDFPEEFVRLWFLVVSHDRYADIVKTFMHDHRNIVEALSEITDIQGRTAKEMASSQCKKCFFDHIRFMERYELDVRVEHKSQTCQVILANDMTGIRENFLLHSGSFSSKRRGNSSSNLHSSSPGTPKSPKMVAPKVALKFMQSREHFEREIAARQNLNMNYVMSVIRTHSIDSDEHYMEEAKARGLEAYPFVLVMPACDRNLGHILQHDFIAGKDWDLIRDYITQLLKALRSIHEIGQIHGDIKPLNIMRNAAGKLILIDLDASVSMDSGYCGTKISSAYCPPEMIVLVGSGSPVDDDFEEDDNGKLNGQDSEDHDALASDFEGLKRDLYDLSALNDLADVSCTLGMSRAQASAIVSDKATLPSRSTSLPERLISSVDRRRRSLNQMNLNQGLALDDSLKSAATENEVENEIVSVTTAPSNSTHRRHSLNQTKEAWQVESTDLASDSNHSPFKRRGSLISATTASEEEDILPVIGEVRPVVRECLYNALGELDFDRMRRRGYSPLAASPSFDMWSLGCCFYQMCSGETLFKSNAEDNADDETLKQVSEFGKPGTPGWSYRQRMLSKIPHLQARNLCSQMLGFDVKYRQDAAHMLSHPFVTGNTKAVSRTFGDAAEYDVFISYRWYANDDIVEKLYDLLVARGLNVWWDKRSLKKGISWEEGFCDGLMKSKCFVPVMSREALKAKFEALMETSDCDNVLLEYRLALELQFRGLVELINPVMVGDVAGNGSFGHYFKQGCHPSSDTIRTVTVNSVEEKLTSHLERQGLGLPLREKMTIFSILSEITVNLGDFIQGDSLEDALTTCADSIQQALHSSSLSAKSSEDTCLSDLVGQLEDSARKHTITSADERKQLEQRLSALLKLISGNGEDLQP